MFKSKWDRWYDNQNAATKAWIDAQEKEQNKFALAIGVPSFFLGIIFGLLFGIGL